MRALNLILALFLGALTLSANPAWEPIGPEVWARKGTGRADDPGAVYIQTHYRFSNLYREFTCRLRIYKEAGKNAANWANFPMNVEDLRGRTVYPDGQEVIYTAKEDFHTIKVAAKGPWEREEKAMVPPGLTDDCVVDLHWRQKFWMSTAGLGGSVVQNLALHVPVDTMVLDLDKKAFFGWEFKPGGQAIDRASTKTESMDSVLITVKDVPAMEALPFSLAPARNIPRFIAHWYTLPVPAVASDASFWTVVTNRFLANLNQTLVMGDTYQDLSSTLRSGLPAEPRALASALVIRLNARIHNLSMMTHAEQVARAKMAKTAIQALDLEAAARRRGTTSEGMFFLYLQLLRDAGLHPKVAYAVDRNVALLLPKERNVGQFSARLIGIEEPGQPTLWIDAETRFAPPGFIKLGYQGTTALEVDTDTREHRFIILPLAPASASTRNDSYRIEVGEDEDKIALVTRLSGSEEFLARLIFLTLEPKAQNSLLKGMLEGNGRTVTKAAVHNAVNPEANVYWTAEGTQDSPPARTRLVTPFPFTPLLVDLPKDLPKDRRDLIVLPQACAITATSVIRIPANYTCQALGPYAHENQFGKVTFLPVRTETPDGTQVELTVDVRLTCSTAPASAWPALVEFLGWMRQAQGRLLVLEQKGE
jgi:hypothetical protein